MFDIGGIVAFISRLEATEGVSDGKLVASVLAASETVGVMFGTDTGKVSEGNVAEGTGGNVDARFTGGKVDARFTGGKVDARFGGGKELDVTIGELELGGSKDGGSSGNVEDPVGREGLKLGYCIGCCIEEGIDKPGGGRSKDCCGI